MSITDLQRRVVEAGIEVFGRENVINPDERRLRFAEEAIELCRALAIPFETMAAMLSYEYYEREPGEVPQEIAGTAVTLLALASSRQIDVGEVVETEIVRILAKKDHCRTKHNAKPAIFKAGRAA